MRRESIPALFLAIALTIIFVVLVPIMKMQWGFVLIPIVSLFWIAIMLVNSFGAHSRQPPQGLS